MKLLFKSHVSAMMSILTPAHGAVSGPLQHSCRLPGGPWPAPSQTHLGNKVSREK